MGDEIACYVQFTAYNIVRLHTHIYFPPNTRLVFIAWVYLRKGNANSITEYHLLKG